MSEIALVSARKVKLENSAKKGSKAALSALKLSQDPDRFLSTVQIGITLIGILTGLYSGEALAQSLAKLLAKSSLLAPYAVGLAQAIIVITVTYLTLIIGELVPKRIGMIASERVAKIVSRPMSWLSYIASPFVWILTKKYSRGMPFLRAFISKRRNHRRRNKSYRSRRYRGRVCTGGGTRHCRTSF